MNFPSTKLSIARQTGTMLVLASFVFSNALVLSAMTMDDRQATTQNSATAKYTTDLTQLGREGRLRENPGFESETARLVKALGNGNSRQPVILSDDKANQDTIVEQLALRIAKGNVPANLANRRIVKLETATLFSNTKFEADATQAIDNVIDDAIASKGIVILYVDELTSLVGSAAASNKLLQGVKDGKLSLIGASAVAAYDETIEQRAEIAALFEPISIERRGATANQNNSTKTERDRGYRGDNLSPDLRQMMQRDPSGRTRVDVIVQAKDADNASLRAMLADGRAHVTDRIAGSDTLVVNLPLAALQTLSSSGLVNYVSPNRPTSSLGHIEETTGLTLMRSQAANGGRPGYTLDGSGVGIAMLDSGIYAAHNGFKANGNSRIVANVNFTTSGSTSDGYGHGTHVAGIAGGSGNYQNGVYRGVANNANLISVKVLDDTGGGQTSWLLSGLNWVLQNKATYNIRVVNLSLGSIATDSYNNDPVCVKVKELVNAGVVVVAAAGNLGRAPNGGKAYGTIHSPGNSPYVITVGAANTYQTASRADDRITTYSSRGPTRSFFTTSTGWKVYDNLMKPDLVAPGNKIASLEAPNNLMSIENPSLVIADPLAGSTDAAMQISGTSMATPVVSGAAALLLQVNPNLTPGMVKMILQYTAQPLSGANTLEQGAGEINLEGAVRLTRSLRTDVDFETLAKGTPTVPAGWTMPATSTTIGGSSFQWSQMITGNRTFMTGDTLVSQFQNVYHRANNFGAGVTFASGSFIADTTNFYTGGVTVNRNVNTSDGGALGTGTT